MKKRFQERNGKPLPKMKKVMRKRNKLQYQAHKRVPDLYLHLKIRDKNKYLTLSNALSC